MSRCAAVSPIKQPVSLGACIPALSILVFVTSGASAQTTDAAAARAFSVVPNFVVSQTFTDNANLTSSNKEADSITQVSPGLRVSSNSGRIKGFFDYSLNGIVYARQSSKSDVQNALNTGVTAEAVEDWAYVDFNANISQQSASAFGTQSAAPTAVNANRTEVATYNLSPFVRGHFGDWADYEARLTRNATRSNSETNYGSSSTLSSGRLNGRTSLAALGWSVNGSHQEIDFAGSGRNTIDLVRLGLDYALTQELHLSANGGRERNNLISPDQQSTNTYGGGFDWRPNERTSLTAELDRRQFGNSHNVRFEYRTPRSVWSFTDARAVSSGNGTPTLGSVGTLYDLLFAQFASTQPDPTLRGQLVDSYLTSNGLDRSIQVLGRFLSTAITLDRTQQLTFAWLGLRDTVALSASHSESQRLDDSIAPTDDFANADQIRQLGLTVTAAHRLTPQSSLNVSASQLKTSGATNSPSSLLRSVTATWSGRFSIRTSLSLGARYSKFDSPTVPYDESAVFGTLQLEF